MAAISGIDALPPDQVQSGDLLRLEVGDRVAADARVTAAAGLWLDESLLTGEALTGAPPTPGGSDPGRSPGGQQLGLAEVVATGVGTELGRIGISLKQVKPSLARLQRQTRWLAARLTVAGMAGTTALLWLHGARTGRSSEAILAALALAMPPSEIRVVLAVRRPSWEPLGRRSGSA